MAKPYDVKEREKLRLSYLKALYEKEQREKTDVSLIITMNMQEAKDSLGLTEVQIDSITTALSRKGKIEGMGGLEYQLTHKGREYIENYLHKINRPLHEKLVERFSSPAIIGGLAGLLMSFIVNVLSASDMPWWLKLLLGKK